LQGKVILVAGGAGAVGHAAIQLARWAGATVIATTSPGKTAYAEAAGAHHVVNYRDADAAAQIRSFAPAGVDVIVEVAAGANNELNLAVLRPLGVIAIYANDGNKPIDLDVRANMGLNARYQFLLLYSVGPAHIAAAGEDISAAIAAGVLPVGEDAGLPVHRFPLADTAAAHQAVEAGATGKVLITVSES
jgi:NADPH2:quinone reductase